jgi:hypothetical protein
MISIVICSVSGYYLSQIKENISNSIGVEYELLVWDNNGHNKGLCEVYNTLAAKARFEYICFVHEDVLFETKDWGSRLIKIFDERQDVGVIGLAGNKYKSKFFSGWYSNIKELDCANVIHRYSHGDEVICLKPEENVSLEEVVCLDGVFICSKRNIWEKVKFNEDQLTGFHFYDIDFTLNAARICTLVVNYEITLIHITTGGDFGDNWVKVAIDYHSSMNVKLPFTKLSRLPAHADMIIVRAWLDVLKNYKISWANKWNWIRLQKLYLHPLLFYSILKFLFYKPLGLKHIHKLVKSK